MIEFKNVTKEYSSQVKALDDISVKIHEGEFVFVVGPSGSGKSTFLKLLTKEEEITSGDIFVNNESLKKMKRRKIPYLRRKMGIVFQDFRVIEKMTVFDNVAFAMHAVGAKSRDIRKRVPYVLNLVGLNDKARRKVSELSGGEKQRVGLARALVNNPGIIIADEPTGNIDPSMSYELVELLSEINKCGTTIIMVTHDISIVEKFNFRVIEILNGKIHNDIPKRGDNQ
ncbi:MAG: cell division ATP-binding protein FtsE [Acutalibacteraceae bacterium]